MAVTTTEGGGGGGCCGGGCCGEVLISVNVWTVRRNKKVAVVERWRLVEVQLYKILHISAHDQTSEVTILS